MIFCNEQGPRQVSDGLADHLETIRLRRLHRRAIDSDLAIDALPTVHRGVVFRSALEASWAATLDSLDIVWEYEPRMVTLPSGARYLPDLHLPEIGVWLEVKGTGVPRVEKALEFSASLACDCPRLGGVSGCTCRWPGGELVVIGHPPVRLDPWAGGFDGWSMRRRLRLASRHPGLISWTSARGRAAWLGRCVGCARFTWFDSPRCRACGAHLVGSHGHQPGSAGLQFIRVSGPATHEPDAPAA